VNLNIEQLNLFLNIFICKLNKIFFLKNSIFFLFSVSQHAASTHMDSSNLAVLWWPNLFQPQFRDLRTAEQTVQKAKPFIQTIIDNYPTIFSSNEMK
jgi:RhoGAP domain